MYLGAREKKQLESKAKNAISAHMSIYQIYHIFLFINVCSVLNKPNAAMRPEKINCMFPVTDFLEIGYVVRIFCFAFFWLHPIR